jgi:transposase
MADAATWGRRVAEWRASGLTSHAFSVGREFTAGGLRHWAYRLGKTRKQARSVSAVRMARVVRVASSPAPEAASDVPIVVEVGGVRVSLRAGFDRATFGAVLDLLGSRGAR